LISDNWKKNASLVLILKNLLLLLLTVGSDSNRRYQNNPNIIIKMSIQGCKDLILSCP